MEGLEYGTLNSYEKWHNLYEQALLGMNINGDYRVEYSGEEYLLKQLSEIIPDAQTLFDVGANIGDLESIKGIGLHPRIN